MRGFGCILLLAGGVWAQTQPERPVLENTGKPMRVAYSCTEDDIRSFGLTCPSEQPCPVYLELAGMDAVGDSVFAAGNLHVENATVASVLLASHDGGKTWNEPFERIRGAGLELIQFLDFENGWVSGQSLGALPRDPFFLITHDGGKTWYNRPVFQESRVAAIDSYQFDSKTHGTLSIDRLADEGAGRYETYESMTGGESWALREASNKRARTEPRRTAPSGWRIHADPRTKSFRLERKAAAGWETVASFLVKAGDCREPEAVLSPPAETQESSPEPAAPRP